MTSSNKPSPELTYKTAVPHALWLSLGHGELIKIDYFKHWPPAQCVCDIVHRASNNSKLFRISVDPTHMSIYQVHCLYMVHTILQNIIGVYCLSYSGMSLIMRLNNKTQPWLLICWFLLTHLPLDMTAISQMTFWNELSWKKNISYLIGISLKSVPKVQLIISQHWFR